MDRYQCVGCIGESTDEEYMYINKCKVDGIEAPNYCMFTGNTVRWVSERTPVKDGLDIALAAPLKELPVRKPVCYGMRSQWADLPWDQCDSICPHKQGCYACMDDERQDVLLNVDNCRRGGDHG